MGVCKCTDREAGLESGTEPLRLSLCTPYQLYFLHRSLQKIGQKIGKTEETNGKDGMVRRLVVRRLKLLCGFA